jgi:hypothetical protein
MVGADIERTCRLIKDRKVGVAPGRIVDDHQGGLGAERPCLVDCQVLIGPPMSVQSALNIPLT